MLAHACIPLRYSCETEFPFICSMPARIAASSGTWNNSSAFAIDKRLDTNQKCSSSEAPEAHVEGAEDDNLAKLHQILLRYAMQYSATQYYAMEIKRAKLQNYCLLLR